MIRLFEFFTNPFKYIAGIKSLLLGMVIIFITSLVAWFSDTWFEGLIGLRFLIVGIPYPYFLLNSLVNWISISVSLYLVGIVFSKCSFRIIDLFGTQLLARLPLLITPLFGFFPVMDRVNKYFRLQTFKEGQELFIGYWDIPVYLVLLFIDVILIIWYFTLMFNAYRISCNLKGEKAIFSFIAAGVISMFIARVLNLFLLLHACDCL